MTCKGGREDFLLACIVLRLGSPVGGKIAGDGKGEGAAGGGAAGAFVGAPPLVFSSATSGAATSKASRVGVALVAEKLCDNRSKSLEGRAVRNII